MSRAGPFLAALAGAACALSGSSGARADEGQSFSIERLRPAVDRDGILDVEWAGIDANPKEYDAALLLGYELNPLVLNLRQPNGLTERVGALVAHRVNGSVLGAFTLNHWVEFGGELPFVAFQTRGDPIAGLKLNALSAVGVGDARLLAKIHVLSERTAGVDVAVIPALTIPTAFPADAYMGDGFFTLLPEIAVARELFGVRVAGNLGARFRPENNNLGLQVGHELTWRLAAGYRFPDPVEERPGPLELDLSVNGATSLLRPFKKVNQEPLEVLGGASYDVVPDLVQLFGGVGIGVIAGFGTPDARVFAGVRFAPRSHDRDGDGIRDDVDECPDDPEDKDGFEDEDGCPDPDNDGDGILDGDDRCPNVKGFAEQQGCLPGDSDGDGIADKDDKCPTEPEDKDQFEDEDGCPDPDNDSDGILDKDDKCPDDPEDKDGFEDADGCPDPDNDGDGILDINDKCPDVPEDMNGIEDDDGCPEKQKIIVTKKKVFTVEKIYFDFNKATIKQKSMPIIEGVAKILEDNPQLGAVRIEGHTDDLGPEAYNLWLSQQRCESVRRALIAHGVPADKLEAKGFGEANPTYDNNTAEGRDKNRRVDFVFIQPHDVPPAKP